MNKIDNNLPKKEFDEFIHAIGAEIEQAQIKLISAANIQTLLHYWKIGHFILYNQQRLGWGSKVIDNISKAIRSKFPKKKGYSSRNLTYMCQFARLYPLPTLQQLLLADHELEIPTIEKVLSVTKNLNETPFTQEPLAQIQASNLEDNTITQEVSAQISEHYRHIIRNYTTIRNPDRRHLYLRADIQN
jgi:hypothetical protein